MLAWTRVTIKGVEEEELWNYNEVKKQSLNISVCNQGVVNTCHAMNFGFGREKERRKKDMGSMKENYSKL